MAAMATSNNQIVIFADARPEQAHLLRNRLAALGIDAYVVNDALQGAVGGLPPGWSIAARVVVAEHDAPLARQVANEFELETSHRAPSDSHSGEATSEGDEADDDEPDLGAMSQSGRGAGAVGSEDRPQRTLFSARCPACGRARMTACPVCATASAEFAEADRPPSSADDEEADSSPLLLCPTCDEPFRPVYLRHCEWCGRDFGAGVEPVVEEVTDQLNDRVIAATIGLALVLMAILAYFASLLG